MTIGQNIDEAFARMGDRITELTHRVDALERAATEEAASIANPDTLAEVLQSAKPGDHILLAGGEYAPLGFIAGEIPSGELGDPITLAAASRDVPVFRRINLSSLHDLMFSDIKIDNQGEGSHHGFRVDNCERITLSQAKATRAGHSGVLLKASKNIDILDVHSFGNGVGDQLVGAFHQHGIYIDGCSGVRIIGGSYSRNTTGFGVHVYGSQSSNLELVDVLATKNAGAGMILTGTDVRGLRLRAEDNAKDGIYSLWRDTLRLKLEDCTSLRNGGAGLRIGSQCTDTRVINFTTDGSIIDDGVNTVFD